ncbi:MAG: hypothetical protein IJU75_05975 [Clostridia bacterium]|nr:hypothetical protein [Clostridia bacterium]
MKKKTRVISILVTVSMIISVLTFLPISGGAATLSINPAIRNLSATASVNAKDIGAYYVHKVAIIDHDDKGVLVPASKVATAAYDLNPDRTYSSDGIIYGAQAESDTIVNPYVCYKISADEGYTVSSLLLSVKYFLQMIQTTNKYFYQIGIWVTDDFSHDGNGAFDFTALPYERLLTSSESQSETHLNYPETIDLTNAVLSLNSRDIYVILLLNRGYKTETYLRIEELSITATQAEPSEPDTGMTYLLEESKYAGTGYKMLRIDATGLADGEVYTFNGEPMYYTEDKDYLIDTNDTGVFYTLIPISVTVQNSEVIMFSGNDLTEAGVARIGTATGIAASEIEYNGDVNGDGVVNIADANAVFQMVVHGGSYYDGQLTVVQRLSADMSRSTNNSEGHASIEDVNEIVNIINGIT